MSDKDTEYLESLTPERAAEVADKIAEQWRRDWGAVLAGVVTRTGLSEERVLLFMMLRELAGIRDGVQKIGEPRFHENCKACQEEREFHEVQFEHMKLANKHLREDHGDEDWKP